MMSELLGRAWRRGWDAGRDVSVETWEHVLEYRTGQPNADLPECRGIVTREDAYAWQARSVR
jgi:hypothetical protein